MDQQVKVFVAKADDVNSVCKIHVVEVESGHAHIVLCAAHMSPGM